MNWLVVYTTGCVMNESDSRILELAKALILIPSIEGNPQGLAHAVRLVRSHIEEVAGVEIDDYMVEGRPCFVAHPAGNRMVAVMLVGHVDVVEGREEQFFPVVRDGRLYGRGAGDMKGQVAILAELFRLLLSERPYPLGLMITSDEESGGEHGVQWLLEKQGVRCEVALIPDSGRIDEIVVREKGVINGKLTTHGVRGHSSRPWQGDNAIHRLVQIIHRLTTRFEALAQGAEQHWHPTLSVNVIATANHAFNRIPGHAEATVDIRHPAQWHASSLLELIEEEAAKEGGSFNVEIAAEPLETEPDTRFQAIAQEVIGREVRFVSEHGGSDGRFFTRQGIPVVMARPELGGLHGDNEWIDVHSMMQFRQIVERYVRQVLG